LETPVSRTPFPQIYEAIIAVPGIPKIMQRTMKAIIKLFIKAKYRVKPAPRELNSIGSQHNGKSEPA
jgi:hypothetical protein